MMVFNEIAEGVPLQVRLSPISPESFREDAGSILHTPSKTVCDYLSSFWCQVFDISQHVNDTKEVTPANYVFPAKAGTGTGALPLLLLQKPLTSTQQ